MARLDISGRLAMAAVARVSSTLSGRLAGLRDGAGPFAPARCGHAARIDRVLHTGDGGWFRVLFVPARPRQERLFLLFTKSVHLTAAVSAGMRAGLHAPLKNYAVLADKQKASSRPQCPSRYYFNLPCRRSPAIPIRISSRGPI